MKENKKNIVIIGFMGCGKTTLGKKLSVKLGYEFIDTDKLIEDCSGFTIPELFEQKGEPYFRRLELETVRKISKNQRCVISTGGGIIKNPLNMDLLSHNGIIVYLEATPEHIYRNVGNDKNRPLLQTDDKMETIRRLMEERKHLYEKYAHLTVDLTGGIVNVITDRIALALEEKMR